MATDERKMILTIKLELEPNEPKLLQNFLCITPGLSKYRFETRDRAVLERVDKTQAQSWLALNLHKHNGF